MEIIDGDLDTFRSLAYTAPPEHVMDKIRSTGRELSSRLLSSASDRFSQVRERVRGLNFDSVRRRTNAALRKLDSSWVEDIIQTIDTVGRFQHAPPVMRRYIMAEPEIRRMFYDNRCEGYGDKYDDVYKGQIGEDDPLWRNVMDGIWQTDEDGDEYFTVYFDSDPEPLEQELDFEEKVCILNTWESLRVMVSKMEDDPTSQFNARL